VGLRFRCVSSHQILSIPKLYSFLPFPTKKD
jgi:hypothetical protein